MTERSMQAVGQKWQKLAEAVRKKAEALPPGRRHEVLARKAGELHVAAHINEWLSSPGLRKPR